MTHPQSFSRPQYRADIDGLRAIAILSVLFFHAYPDSLFIRGGFVGVDIFFVISGYLISSIIFRGLEHNTFSFFDFYARRIRRIFPAVAIVLLGSIVAGFFLLTSYEFEDLVRETPYAAFFAENWRLYTSTGGYWDTATELRPLMHFWSLGVEEQYYVFYPLLCAVLWKIGSRRLLACLIFAFIVSFGLCLYDSANDSIRAFYSLHSRFWELLAGGILAYIEIKWPNYKKGWFGVTDLNQSFDNAVACIGGLFIVCSILLLSQSGDFPGWKALFPVLGTVLLIGAGNKTVINSLLANKCFVFIGLISYPLYLWHWPLISIARNNLSGVLPTGTLMVAILVLGFVLAYLTYILIERPMRSRRATWQMCLVLALVLLVLTVGLKTLIRKSEAVSSYVHSGLPDVLQPVFYEASKSSKTDSDCENKFGKGNSVCKKLSDSPKALLWGDSHNYTLWNYLDRENLQPDIYLVGSPALVIFENTYRFKDGKPDIESFEITNRIWRKLSTSPEITTVVLRGFWSSYLSVGGLLSEKYPKLDGTALEQQLWKDTFAKLAKLGKSVILVLDNIDVEYNPLNKYFLPRRISLQRKENVDDVYVSYAEINSSHLATREFLKNEALRWSNVTVLDSWTELCDFKGCYLAKNGVPYYKDDDHLSIYGNALVWQLIQKQLEK